MQQFSLHLDTGSSDLWVNVAESSFCRSLQASGGSGGGGGNSGGSGGNFGSGTGSDNSGYQSCSVSGTYSANHSSSYRYVNSRFVISYADDSGARGDYVTDTLRMGGTTLPSQQFGVGYSSSSSEGVFGIGFPNLEVAVQNARQPAYPNVPQALTDAGVINAPSYSLWLDDLNSATGSILFGGVDTAKYTGQLQPLQILRSRAAQPLEMIVALDGFSVQTPNNNVTLLSQSTPVLLDSGSTLSYLPSDVANALYQQLGARYNARSQVAECPCALANSSHTLTFAFAAKSIVVPLSEMVLPGGSGDPGSSTGCLFGVVAQDASSSTSTDFALGDTFLRSAYAVYDLAGGEIALAQTNFDAGAPNVKEISSGGGIPDAAGAAPSPTIGVSGGPTAVGKGAGSATSSGVAATAAPGRAEWVAGLGLAMVVAAL